jgi:hypothetical protein
LKAALEGGVEGRPANVIFYATSNRRHLLPRDMIDNERSTAINPSEAVEEKVSLSDRFGLWLGFHKCSQDEYLEMVDTYVAYHALAIDADTLRAEALEWATTRGRRPGRGAFQFTHELVGRLFAILLDEMVITAPMIREPIRGGSGQISGHLSEQGANYLAVLLRSGALPAKLSVLETHFVPAAQ